MTSSASGPGPAAAPPRPRSDVFAGGLAVLSGWYATVAGALLLWLASMPDPAPARECREMLCQASPRDLLALILQFLVAGTPALVAGGLAAVATVALAAVSRIRSAVVTGTLAAAVGLLVSAALPGLVVISG